MAQGSVAGLAGSGARLLELAAVVSRLQAVCPWTQAQGSASMLAFTRTELVETEEAMAASSGAVGVAHAEATAHLESELGDVLFDVLMLIEACSKDHGTGGLERVCSASVAKLRRRAPYAFDGGPKVQTANDTDRLWQAGKDAERAERAASETQLLAAPFPASRATPAQQDLTQGPSPGVATGTANVLIGSLSLLAGETEDEDEGLEEWRQDLARDLAVDSALDDSDDTSSQGSD
ncbi:hypothetical protein T492DRAFT_1011621 [Pavlovales sp. CCMP2436]|nr:hypothetical protein T492DRAFT_1011621 [Pavlovales sp. CCMP2436]